MRLSDEQAHSRLVASVHGVLATLHPERGPDPQPVVYAISDDRHVGVPIDTVKPKASSRLQREDNLEADPRGALLVEHWDTDDWSRLCGPTSSTSRTRRPPCSTTWATGSHGPSRSTPTSPSTGCSCAASSA